MKAILDQYALLLNIFNFEYTNLRSSLNCSTGSTLFSMVCLFLFIEIVCGVTVFIQGMNFIFLRFVEV